MTLILSTPRPTQNQIARTLRFFGATALSALAAAGRWISAEIDRRQTAQLLGADDRMLADIGISRADVHRALLTDSGAKPSEHLENEKRARRQAERAQVEEARDSLVR